jgi:hypothetical protein
MIVPPPVELITPSVMSIFVRADNKHDTSLSTILIFVPSVIVCCNPVVEITPSVMFIFVPAVKSRDISSPSMEIFAPVVNSFCFVPTSPST